MRKNETILEMNLGFFKIIIEEELKIPGVPV
jgi:hypothetical protein